MQRLAYTPKVYVFVKNSYGNIIDISRYVVSGSVNRRLDAVSSAQIILRNPKMIFTTPDANARVAFSPMDPVTIYLKRLRSRPVRVFTGFLNKTPYLKLYPGVVELRASCTLKRLLYTFFDPALPYTQSFFIAYGWTPNANGTWFSADALNDWRRHAADDHQATQGKDTSIDGSISNLLFATLRYIGHWDPDDIFIEKLPKDLFARLTGLAQEFQDENEQAGKEFEELLRRMIGEGDFSGSGNASGDVDVSGIKGDVPEQVYKVGREMQVPYKHLLAAMETGLVESPNGSGSFGNPSQANSDAGTAASGASAGWRQETANNYPGVDRNNVPEAAKRFYTECKQLDHGQSESDLAAEVQRPAAAYRGRYAQVHDQAVTLLRKIKAKVEASDANASATPGSATDPDRTVRASAIGDNATSSTKTATNPGYVHPMGSGLTEGRIDMGFDWSGKGDIMAIGRAKVTRVAVQGSGTGWPGAGDGGRGNRGAMIVYQLLDGPRKDKFVYLAENIDPVANLAVGDTLEAGQVYAHARGAFPWLEIGWAADGAGRTLAAATTGYTEGQQTVAGKDFQSMLGNLKKGTPIGASSADTSAGGTKGADNNTAGAGVAGAFFATLQLPSFAEAVEAQALGGEKSLMNDKPLMPFIQQLTEACMRHFQSLPDGKFFAFYPDYFGEMNARAPYWEIDDIEVLDGGIDLTDDTVVTHQYVIGDTINQRGAAETPLYLRSIISTGVVTIFNAFMADDLLTRTKNKNAKDGKGPAPITKDSPRGMDIILSRDEAVTFLQRYGARPAVEDMPMIKHPFFEMFMAYQRFLLAWAKQFSTTFSFTFMPELYPGGKVGFPDHGLQLYIEEVTHSFDYTSGFTTQATLSAPSVYGTNVRNLPPNMVKAIIEPSTPHKGTPASPGMTTFGPA